MNKNQNGFGALLNMRYADIDSLIDALEEELENGGGLESCERALDQLLRNDKNNMRVNRLMGAVMGRMGRPLLAAQYSIRAFLASERSDQLAADNIVESLRALPASKAVIEVLEDIYAAFPSRARYLCALLYAKLKSGFWNDIDLLVRQASKLGKQKIEGSGIHPYQALCIPGIGALSQRLITKDKYREAAELWPRRPPVLLPKGSHARAKLHIGYLCSDFHLHPTSFLMAGVLEESNRERFVIHAIVFDEDDGSEIRSRIRAALDGFHEIRNATIEERDTLLQSLDLDILVDLDGWIHNERFRFSTNRLARVIVNWLGFPGTMGETELADYILGDPVVTPLEHAGNFSEYIAQMPGCYQPNDRKRVVDVTPTRQEVGLSESAFVFCSFNGVQKITPQMFDAWCRILRDVPEGVLWLADTIDYAKNNLIREASDRGVDPVRIIFAPILSQSQHLARLSLADIALDTAPYNSHTTGSDVLWAGVPMITLQGQTFPGRVGASLLNAAGIPECIVNDMEDYVSLATRLANSKDLLCSLRVKLSQNRLHCSLFDTVRFARDLEGIYEKMWKNHMNGVHDHILA